MSAIIIIMSIYILEYTKHLDFVSIHRFGLKMTCNNIDGSLTHTETLMYTQMHIYTPLIQPIYSGRSII